MFKWYFQIYFVENSFLLWFSVALIIAILFVTVYYVRKVLKDQNADK